MTLAADVDELTDEQRALVRGFFEEKPDGGYKQACRLIGIRATKDEARKLIEDDAELSDFRMQKLGLDEGSLFRQLGKIAQDPDHRDQLKALTFGLGAIHGHGQPRVDTSDGDGAPTRVVVEHDFGSLIDKLEDVGLLRRGPVAAVDGEGQRLLPPPAE